MIPSAFDKKLPEPSKEKLEAIVKYYKIRDEFLDATPFWNVKRKFILGRELRELDKIIDGAEVKEEEFVTEATMTDKEIFWDFFRYMFFNWIGAFTAIFLILDGWILWDYVTGGDW